MKKIKPAPRKPITKLKKPYEGGDALMEWHKEKMKSSASEAYKDVDYATPIWRCENDWDRAKEYIVWGGMWVFFLFLLYQGAIAFEKWIGS
jgi:hypothetical protein